MKRIRVERERLVAAVRIGGVMVAAATFCNATCNSPPTGNLEVLSNGTPAFDSATGFAQSFFSSDNALGPAQEIALSSSRVVVRYSDSFSTFNSDPTVNSSQEEVLVLTRDPIEYRHTLESIVGPDPTINHTDPGRFLEWAAQTFAPGDTWPITDTTLEPKGVMLPNAISFPYPNASTSPQTDWLMTQAMFTGSASTPFVGPAGSFGGTIKGLSVMRRGVCSFEQSITDALSSITDIPLHGDIGIAGYDISGGLASFVSYAPNGGFVVSAQIDGFEPLLPPLPPIPTTFQILVNYTYNYALDDGIFAVEPTQNTYNVSEVSGIAGGQFFGVLNKTVPDDVKLSALEGKRGSFKGGQAQPIPALFAGGASTVCSDTSKQRPSSCFTLCASSDTVDMTNPGTFPPEEDLGDPTTIDPPSWHDSAFCGFPAAAIAGITTSAASTYSGMTPTGPTDLSNAVLEPLNGDTTKLHNFRCNFHPRYEAGTTSTTDPLTTGHPFNIGEKPLLTGPPVCEVIVRIKRINVFPDAAEAVFFDGPDLQHVDPIEFGGTTLTGLGNEAFALFLGLQTISPGSSAQLCSRHAETNLVTRSCAHALLH